MIPIIKELRKNLGMKQHAFAELLGVSQSSVSSWEKGKSKQGETIHFRPRPDICFKIIKLAKLYGMTILLEELLQEESSQSL